MGHSTTYYRQGNGFSESSNKTLVRILKNTISENPKIWDSQLKFSLGENRVTTKRSIGKSPFEFVYGNAVIFPMQTEIPVAKLFQDAKEEPNSLTRRINHLLELQENMGEVTQNLVKFEEKMKYIFNRRAKDRLLHPRDLVFRWDVRR